MSYYFTRQLVKAIDKLREELLESIQQQTEAISKSTEATRENKRDPLPVPLHVSAELQTPEADKAEQRTRYGENRNLQVWLAVGTWLAFAAAAYYANVARGQLDEMKKSTAATRQSAYAACVSAQISRSVLLETQRTEADSHGSTVATVYQAMAATESERAEIEVTMGKPEINDHEFGLNFGINNAGKTAGIGVRAQFRLIFIGESENPDFRYPKKQTATAYSGRVEPGPVGTSQGQITHLVVIGTDGNAVIPNSADKGEYNSGRKDLIFYGRTTYRDIFGGHHWRNFCQPFHVFPIGLIKKSEHPKCALYNGSDTGSGLVKETPAPPKPSPLPEIVCKLPD